MNEREIVLNILMEVLERGRYSHIVLGEMLGKYQDLDKKKLLQMNQTRIRPPFSSVKASVFSLLRLKHLQ